MVLVSEATQLAAVLAALNDADAAAYDLDAIKEAANRPAYYTEVTVTARYGAEPRNTGSTGRRGWRITTRVVGDYASNAQEIRKRVDTGLRYVRLTVDGATTTPIQFESEDPIGEDDGWFSGLTTWTYAI